MALEIENKVRPPVDNYLTIGVIKISILLRIGQKEIRYKV